MTSSKPPYRALLGFVAALWCGAALANGPPPVAGTTAGTFAAGNDSRVVAGGTAVQPGSAAITGGTVGGVPVGYSLPTMRLPRSGIIPAQHLTRFNGLSNPVVCIAGDSTSTPAANNLVPDDMLWYGIQRRMREDNPAKTITFINRAIASTTMQNFLAYAPVALPSWYQTSSLWWNTYVQAAGCDTLFLNWGVNDSFNLNAYILQNTLSNIASWGTAPAAWQANHAYVQGNVVLDSNGRLETVANAGGTSGATAPSWPVVANGAVGDGGVVWVLPVVASYVAKTPDIILITNKIANPTASGNFGLATYQAGYLAAASVQRTAVQSNYKFGITGLPAVGLIDVGRAFAEAVLGIDPAEQYMGQSIVTPVTVTPSGSPSQYLLPTTAGDFDITLTIPGAGMMAAGTTFQFVLGTADGTATSGNITSLNVSAYLAANRIDTNYYPTNGVSPQGFSNTTVWNGSGSNTLQVTLRGPHLYIQANGLVVADTNVVRYNSPSRPLINVFSAPAGFSYVIASYNVGTSRSYAPLINYADCYGTLSGVSGGNGINHTSSRCMNLVEQYVLDATRFAP